MTRIIAFVLRAGGAAAGAFTLGRMPAEVYAPLLEKLGIADAPWLTPTNEMIALYAIGALFGLLFGSVIAGLLPSGSREPVGTREEAAASVPRLRRHLGTGQGSDKRGGSPLDRLSAPPAGQQLPKHDLSNIPPAPPEDEISFERIPNTGVYADVESHVDFALGEDDEDLKRFAASRIVDEPASGRGWDDDDWGEDEWSTPAAEPAVSEPAAYAAPQPVEESQVDDDFAAFNPRAAEPVAEPEPVAEAAPEWPINNPMPPTLEEQGWGQMQRGNAQGVQPEAMADDAEAEGEAEAEWPAGIPMPPTLEEQGWGQMNRRAAEPVVSPEEEHEAPAFAEPEPLAEDFAQPAENFATSHEEEWAAFNPPADFDEAAPATDAPAQEPAVHAWAAPEPEYRPVPAPHFQPEFHAEPPHRPDHRPEPEPESRVVSLGGNDGYKGHDGVSAPRFAPGLTGGADEDWFAGDGDEDEDADDDGAGYGSLMAIGLGKTHKPRPKQPSHRLGEANLSHSPLLDVDRDMGGIPKGAGPQDFRLREALEGLKRF